MLNLSDKELDRLSREAANQHDPGDLLGSRSWDRLEFRLDKELGRLTPSPLRGVRGIRRIPFYYAPAILLLIGASYFFIRHGKGNASKTEPSGSPPTALVKPLSPGANEPNTSTQTPENSQNSTSKPDKALSADYPAATPGTATTPNTGATAPNTGAAAPASGNSVSSNTGSPSGLTAPGASRSATNTSSGASHSTASSGKTTGSPNGTTGSPHNTTGSSNKTPRSPNVATGSSNGTTGSSNGTIASSNRSTPSSPGGTTGSSNRTTTPFNRSAASSRRRSASSQGVGATPQATNGNTAGANSTMHGTTGHADASGTTGNTAANTTTQAATTPNHKTGATGKSFQDGTASAQGANGRHHRPAGNSQDKSSQDRKNNKPATDEEDDAAAAASLAGNTSNTSTTSNPGNAKPQNQPSATIAPREALSSSIQAPRSLTRSAGIDDASLRAFAMAGKPVATPITLGKKKNSSGHIARPLTFGFSVSPDFASVHSVAGDKPGRSIGLTMDYQVLDGFYIGTGLLFTRKNYTANPDNFHAPRDSYRTFTSNKVDLIKGSFDMVEIPLNLRYDFRANSNTVFFISGGASSYLLTSEHSQYYFDYFGIPTCLNFDKRLEPKNKNYLFSSVNLSMGVETGISNSLSLLVAPYVKIPTSGMGLGQVQITSVGLNFALRYSPVLNRKRK